MSTGYCGSSLCILRKHNPLVLLLSWYHILIFIRFCDCQWFQANSTLPWGQSCMVIGSYNDSIHILGGGFVNVTDASVPTHDRTIYSIQNDVFASSQNYLSVDIFGYSSYYTQIRNVLYIIAKHGTTILSYDMQTETIDSNYTTIPNQVASDYQISSCITSYTSNTNTYLFISGGAGQKWNTQFSTAQVYDISNSIWLSNVSSMQQKRFSHTCVVDPVNNNLFAIGGKGESKLTSIEFISTIDIDKQEWSYFPNTLSNGVRDTQSVYFDTIIYVIGGTTNSNADSRYDTVHMIDTESDTVTVEHILPYGISSAAVLLLNHRLYVFGGYDGTKNVDTWMFYDFTAQPTNMPSAAPFALHTDIPSTAPNEITFTTNISSITQTNLRPNEITSTTNISSITQTNLPTNDTPVAPSFFLTDITKALMTSNSNTQSFDITTISDTQPILRTILIIAIVVSSICCTVLLCRRHKDSLKAFCIKINKRNGSKIYAMDNKDAEQTGEMMENDMDINIQQCHVKQTNASTETSGRIMTMIQNHQQKLFEEIQESNNEQCGERGDGEEPIDMMRTVEGAPNEAVDGGVSGEKELNLERSDSFIVKSDSDSDLQHETTTGNAIKY